jgi:ubiquinone/menaquinone biosynthesis C-methylase UbiE
VKDGVAEAIPLPDGSVDAVTVADGFHWFDGPPAIAEVRRVLRPLGGLAVLNCLPDWSGASWAAELRTMVEELRPEHPFFDGTPWQDTVREAGGWTEPRYVQVIAVQPTDPERIVNHVASMSFVAALDDAERTEFMRRIGALLETGETPDEVPVNVGVGLSSLT